jgi:DNA polymerase III alpha subunit
MYLNCKTWFSFRYGTIETEMLVRTAASRGISALALTNINNTSDVWDFVDYCKQYGVKPIAGAEIRNEEEFCYILLAKNNKGFLAINRFLSHHLQQKIPFPKRKDFCEDIFVIYALGAVHPEELSENELIGVQYTEVTKLFGVDVMKYADKFVIRQPVTHRNKEYYELHLLLRAIDKNTLTSKLEEKDHAGKHEILLNLNFLLQHFQHHSSIITNTLRVIDACSIDINFNVDKTKKIYSASKADDKVLLEKLAMDGMKKRYGTRNKEATARVIKELKIIDDLGFNAYFLITWDILRYAHSRGFFYVGRGSGANSIVAYCLRITDVDPIGLDLYFERFLNPYRSVPPDFDIDFSWKDRDEIIDYIFKRYGREYVCLLGSTVTFQQKAVIRELGKVYGLPKEEIDQLDAGSDMDEIKKKIIRYGRMLKDFPNHPSIHAGGMLISEEPLCTYSAVELPPKNFSVSQIDMFVAEKIGLFKLDILSQRGLGHIKEAVEIIKENKNASIDIHDVQHFMKDPKVAKQIRDANTIGCFYIESPAMRQLLKKLRCDNYITLVAASSIIRPGVSQSGMMRQYIQRFHDPSKIEYLHPVMKELLEETYGVMVYQEDVIKVAHHFGKLDMAEADVLRRAMSGKYRSHKHFEIIKEKYFNNCKAEGYSDEVTNEVWRQIESFGGYSFSKAHSASFAVESYQSLFLKTYYPLEFMVAVINNFGGFYSRELYFTELKKAGGTLHLPCVNSGEHLTSIHGTEITIGFIHIQGLEEKLTLQLIDERKRNGPYKHLQDFIERIKPGLEQLNILIRIGALRFTGKNKKELLWQANFLQKKNLTHNASGLFYEAPVEFNLPALKQHPLDDSLDEIELLGFPASNVFELVDDDPGEYVDAKDLHLHVGREVAVLGYLVTSKPVRTVTGQTMFFHTFLDAKNDWLDTVFFADVSKWHAVTGKGFYSMKGKVIEEFGTYSVEVRYSKKIGIKDRGQEMNNLLGKEKILAEV